MPALIVERRAGFWSWGVGNGGYGNTERGGGEGDGEGGHSTRHGVDGDGDGDRYDDSRLEPGDGLGHGTPWGSLGDGVGTRTITNLGMRSCACPDLHPRGRARQANRWPV